MRCLILLLILVACGGCVDVPRDLGLELTVPQRVHEQIKIKTLATGKTGQIVAYVPYVDFKDWIKEHLKEARIDAITSVDKDGYGSTSGFIVVYSEQ